MLRKYTGSCTSRIQTKNDQNLNLRKWHLQLFSVHWSGNQVSHYPSPLLGIKKGYGGVRVGERECCKITWIVVQKEPWGKVTQRLLAWLLQLGIQKTFLHQGLKHPFLPLPCTYGAGWRYGPRRGWHSFSLRKCEANHWVRTNHASPQHKVLLSQH